MIKPTRHNLIVPTAYGDMLVNRHAGEFDALAKFGTSHSHKDIELVSVLAWCGGPGGMVIDVGACFGAFTLALAGVMAERGGWVLAFEPQEWLFHCLAGSVALNDLSNVRCRQHAVGARNGLCTVLAPDYTKAAHFGSMPIKDFATADSLHDFEQTSDPAREYQVPMVALDSLGLEPALIKIDVEGMQMHVLAGAEETVARSRPVLYVEHLKASEDELKAWFEDRGYMAYVNGCDYCGLPREKRGQYPNITYEEVKP